MVRKIVLSFLLSLIWFSCVVLEKMVVLVCRELGEADLVSNACMRELPLVIGCLHFLSCINEIRLWRVVRWWFLCS